MSADITDRLPKVISDCLAACNAHDIEAWMATFAPDALLNANNGSRMMREYHVRF